VAPKTMKVDMDEEKRLMLEREHAHKEWMNSHWKSILIASKSLTLDEKVDVEQFSSERTHELNVSKFWVKL